MTEVRCERCVRTIRTSNGSPSRPALQLLGWTVIDGDRYYCPTHVGEKYAAGVKPEADRATA